MVALDILKTKQCSKFFSVCNQNYDIAIIICNYIKLKAENRLF